MFSFKCLILETVLMIMMCWWPFSVGQKRIPSAGLPPLQTGPVWCHKGPLRDTFGGNWQRETLLFHSFYHICACCSTGAQKWQINTWQQVCAQTFNPINTFRFGDLVPKMKTHELSTAIPVSVKKIMCFKCCGVYFFPGCCLDVLPSFLISIDENPVLFSLWRAKRAIIGWSQTLCSLRSTCKVEKCPVTQTWK